MKENTWKQNVWRTFGLMSSMKCSSFSVTKFMFNPMISSEPSLKQMSAAFCLIIALHINRKSSIASWSSSTPIEISFESEHLLSHTQNSQTVFLFVPYAAQVGSSRQKYSTIIANDASYMDSVKSSIRYSTSLSLSKSFAVNLCHTFGYSAECGRFHFNSTLSAIRINSVFSIDSETHWNFQKIIWWIGATFHCANWCWLTCRFHFVNDYLWNSDAQFISSESTF